MSIFNMLFHRYFAKACSVLAKLFIFLCGCIFVLIFVVNCHISYLGGIVFNNLNACAFPCKNGDYSCQSYRLSEGD